MAGATSAQWKGKKILNTAVLFCVKESIHPHYKIYIYFSLTSSGVYADSLGFI